MKTKQIILGIIAALILVMVTMFFSTQNKAINLEEQINEAHSAIEVQDKRRVDLVYNLADVVKEYSQYEGETLIAVVEARSSSSTKNIETIGTNIQAIAEAYPELKADSHYQQLMTELSITENGIAEHRDSYNKQVKSYKKYVRSFPAKLLLPIMGYEVIDFEYLEFSAPSDAPQNLFDR